jgi:HEAT repeat protein
VRGKYAVILVAVVLGGFAGAAAVVSLSRSPIHSEVRVEGRTLREWTLWLDDPAKPELREKAWAALPRFRAADAAGPLVELLGSGSEETRERAEAALVTMRSAAVPRLTEAVRDASPFVRIHAIDALRQMGFASSPAVDAIASRLSDPAAGGVAAAYFVEHGAPPVAVTAALGVLEDPQASRRREAIEVLARAPSDARAVAALLREAAKPTTDGVQAEAFHAVCQIPDPPREVIDTLALGLARPELEQDAKRALLKAGSAAAGTVARFSEHDDPRVRAAAAEVLAGLAKNDPPIADSLIPFLYDDDDTVSRIASEGLMPMWRSDPSQLREHLRSASPNARRWAAHAIVILKAPMMEDAVALLDDPEQVVREHADKAVRRLWSDRDAEVLAAMKQPDPIERARLVRMLPFCRDPGQRISVMLDAMQDSDLNVRRAAVAALGDSVAFTRAIDRLIDALKFDYSPTVRSDAANALAPARSTMRISAALAEAEKDPDPAVAAAAREARLSGRALR